MLAIVGLPFAAQAAPVIAPHAGGMIRLQLGTRLLPAAILLGLAGLAIFATLIGFLISLAARERAFEQLREAINVMPNGLVVWDSDDRLLAWNDRFIEIGEPDLSRLRVGMPVTEFLQMIAATDPTVEPDDQVSWVRERKIARRRPRPVLERKTSSGRWLRIENRPTARGGLVAVSVDVTDFKDNAERLAQARDAAEAANKAKNNFLANISHEIRTPMNGVIGMTELLLHTDLSPEQRRFAEGVRRSADEMMAIVSNILDLARLEAGKGRARAVDLNIEALAGEVVDQVRPRALEKSLNIAVAFDDGARRGALRGDPVRLRQILLNLMSNAVKFTETGRRRGEVISAPLSGQRTLIRVEVHDTGIGLSAEAKARLFQKFQQADGSITRRYGGTGLGLSICRQLVELMGGRIGADDRPGGGSTFWFEAPLPNGGA